MNTSPVRIAVIGCGGYAFQLIKRILSVPHFGAVAAVTSRDLASSGAQFCRDRGIPVFATIDELLDYGNFEVVLNPTPIHLHESTTVQCMEAGFPVWLEKPPVATIQELDSLNAYAKAKGMPVAVCFNSLFSRLTQTLKGELVAGRFGRVRRIKGIGAWIRTNEYFSRNNWAGNLQINEAWILDGDLNNPFAHVLCNHLYFAADSHYALAEPETIEAELYRCNEITSEDTSCLRIKTTNGIEIFNCLTLGPEEEIAPKTVIETDEAVITFANFNALKIEFASGKVEMLEAYKEDRIDMIEHLCWAFRNGEPYISTLDMMRPFTLSVNGAFEASKTIETIPEPYAVTGFANGVSRRYIRDMGSILESAFESVRLFSELNVPWASPRDTFRPDGYSRFPVRFLASGNGSNHQQ